MFVAIMLGRAGIVTVAPKCRVSLMLSGLDVEYQVHACHRFEHSPSILLAGESSHYHTKHILGP
jgi:hypothetical protein